MDVLISEIIRGQQPVRTDLALKAQVPLLDVCRLRMHANVVVVSAQRKSRTWGEDRRKRIPSRIPIRERPRRQIPRIGETRIRNRRGAVPGNATTAITNPSFADP